MSRRSVPDLRAGAVNAAPLRPGGAFVLYWMIAARRARWNFGLQRAVERAVECRRPLVVLEALRCDYPYASDRLHRFVLDGMADNRDAFAGSCATYHAYVEPGIGAGKGLLEALAAQACCVVTDAFPSFFLPRMVATAADRLPVRLEAVDSNGLLPLRAASAVFPTAYAFRRFLQKTLPEHLDGKPVADPLLKADLPRLSALPRAIRERWPEAPNSILRAGAPLASLPIDHGVPPSPIRGGARAAAEALARFVSHGLPRYATGHNDPDANAVSGLSPYLHFGHVSAHEIFARVARRERWSAGKLGSNAAGKREGWWGMSASAEAFLDQLVTWRELGYNYSSLRDDADRFSSLPAWARKTLADHARDPRRPVYDRETLETACTHDPLWNAAQRQLLIEGRIHNYLRMLWGKKILEWSESPSVAWERLVALNDRHALDGRDPNSYSGIGWVLGRYDRPWGPERPIYGTVRYMTSANTARKLALADYLRRFGADPPLPRGKKGSDPESGS